MSPWSSFAEIISFGEKSFLFTDVMIKTFQFSHNLHGNSVTVTYPVEIPLPEYAGIDDVFGQFICSTGLLEPFRSVARTELENFIVNETHAALDEIAESNVNLYLEDSKEHQTANLEELKNSGVSDVAGSSLDNDFQFIVKNCPSEQLMRLISLESGMTNEMNALTFSRDLDLSKLRKACEEAVEKTSEISDNIEEHSYNLSILNEKLRNCNNNYNLQIYALIERQKAEFLQNVQKLRNGEEIEENKIKKLLSSGRVSRQPSLRQSSVQEADENLEESFTIYIGTQMKTMHNARIAQYDAIVDICHRPLNGDPNDSVEYSHHLNMLMSLYGRDLSAAVILVDRDPLYHIHARTEFFRLCENSVELHFDNLESQLRKMVDTVSQCIRPPLLQLKSVTRNRREHSLSHSGSSYNSNLSLDEHGQLKLGDVYITAHSNLNSVQLVFHLVTDKSLESHDINSRNPCLNGLRNCVKLAARNSVSTLSVPLFLVPEMSGNMTIQWCLNRSELVFKCMKGFLMEVFSSTSNSSPNGSATARPVHYNINFFVPSKISKTVFDSIVDIFPNIFHLVPTVNA